MVLVDGTNCGFVTVAPTADPGGTNYTIDTYNTAFNDTSPSNANSISEMGFWAESVVDATTYQIGLYSDDGSNTPDDLLASGTGTIADGWNTAVVNYTLTPNTIYHLAVQVDDAVSAISGNLTADATRFFNVRTGATELNNPWGVSEETGTNLLAIYAVYSTEQPPVVPVYGETGGIGSAAIRTNYPVVQGLEADEKHDGEENNLIAEQYFIDPKMKVLL